MNGDGADGEPGEFWIATASERRARGVLTRSRGTAARVRLDEPLVDGPQLSTVEMDEHEMRVSYRPPTAEESVSSFQPVTLRGRLDSGVELTGLTSQNHGGDGQLGILPDYQIQFLVLGEAVDGVTTYDAIRFETHASSWLPQVWTQSDLTCVVTRTGLEGALTTEIDSEGYWIVYQPRNPMLLRDIIESIATACLVFVEMVLDRDVQLRTVQVIKTGRSQWIHVISPRTWDTSTRIRPDTLMPPETITLERFACFVDLHDQLDGLTDPIAKPIEGQAIQVELLANAAIVEGVHRRLWSHRARFDPPPNASLKVVRRAARTAGVASFVEQGIADELAAAKCLTDALAYINDISFIERVRDVVGEVSATMPEVFESVAAFPERLVGARNELAHQLVPDDEIGETLSVKVDRWAVLNYTTPWMLRVLVLLRSGVTPLEIRHSFIADGDLFHGYQRFEMYRANVRAIAHELGWLADQ